ncbi:MAG TPA: hypothetical protein PKI46_09055 [Bacteroidales bacterium]|nr:hypothetical protein [Bacteroidales bacterium]
MKIGLTEIYHNYATALNQEKAYLTEQKNDYEKTKSYILEKISNYEHYIRNFTNIEYNAISSLDRCISERSLIKLAEIAEVNIDIRRNINVIVYINKNLTKINEDLDKVNKNIINATIHKNILCYFNNSISDVILSKGYTYKPGSQLGVIKIKKVLCDKRVKRNIDWNESNKRRKELEAEGKIPYKVTERDENRKIVSDNGGVPWFVYFTGDFDYLWHWSKNHNRVFNSSYYRFRPTMYNNQEKGGRLGNINKLAELKRTNSPLLKNFI